MKKHLLFSLLILGISQSDLHAQWVESGNAKNSIWDYSFAKGSGAIKGKGLKKESTPASQNFLPKPPSGEVSVSTSDEDKTGESSFTLNSGCSSCLTIGHTSGYGLKPAPSKFVARNFAGSSKVMSTHFKINLNHTAKNKQAIWYLAVGDASNAIFANNSSVPLITNNGPTDHTIYTILRLRKTTFEGKYGLQVRYGNETTKWGWQTISGVGLEKDTEYQIDLFFNNTDQPQDYTHKGETKSLAAAAYHIYVNGVQKGANLSNLTRNIVHRTDDQKQYTGNLSGFAILSREGAQSFTDGTTSTDPTEDDNSASVNISDLKIVHKPVK